MLIVPGATSRELPLIREAAVGVADAPSGMARRRHRPKGSNGQFGIAVTAVPAAFLLIALSGCRSDPDQGFILAKTGQPQPSSPSTELLEQTEPPAGVMAVPAATPPRQPPGPSQPRPRRRPNWRDRSRPAPPTRPIQARQQARSWPSRPGHRARFPQRIRGPPSVRACRGTSQQRIWRR